ncbi:Inner membrane ALBINO3-like protein 2, chloroplastic Flags: Precursor [Monoraphidium neglectum]|uniref:Membrane insertase YidC/Oxa/ALB C-terminal domain-containing protein n=1 Tax=Monoraphidium neglectum TaxID=145388 RepID=A0A0D2LEX3_9CHLO|nr:Inner membrane ALBINO3-like protein 2, chloroplastic Flags: Precursor [Monoraphidium neglectum]KIZ05214.1 Inner membrane ALBINO3-like protein 2, chloroplastic Flags: Precursor [Monoraphidium neglectum]|eukprot:XP_013904233.1 Inner membrane ALBINO3-like protein 2, chloroplastic Flags: Precursor [Monoraphidium neglectum]
MASRLPPALHLLADDAAAAAPKDDGGWFGWLTDGFEAILAFLDSALESAHVPYSYGFAIILLTILVKLATFPLSQKSMQSSLALQALQPRVKELQALYATQPEALQLETARLYREAGVNPLAGCLPTLATIPALTKAADDGLLTSGFFWIPSLGGPTTLAMRQEGSGLSWLFPFVDGAPPVGWHDAIAYLVLPVLLVASQIASQNAISPKSDDPVAQQSQAILKFIPFMIGWFSLNVPSGLTLYWFVYMRNTIKVEVPASAAAGPGPGAIIDVSGSPIIPSDRARARQGRPDGPIVEAEIVSGPPLQDGGGGSRRGSRFAERKAKEAAAKRGAEGASGGGLQPRRGGKFAERKAREAAAKAAVGRAGAGADSGSGAAGVGSGEAAAGVEERAAGEGPGDAAEEPPSKQ